MGTAEIKTCLTNACTEVTNAKNEAVNAKTEAVNAKTEAVTAKDEAVTAKTEAVTAKDEAVTAKDEAVTAKTEAVNAKTEAVTAKDEAVTVKDEAVTAKDEAVTAKDEAVTAKTDAVTAKDEAVTAKDEAVTAKNEAENIVASTGAISEEIDKRGIITSENFAWAIADQNENLSIYIDKDGAFNSQVLSIDGVQIIGNENSSAPIKTASTGVNITSGDFRFIESTDAAFAIADQAGSVVFSIDNNGEVHQKESKKITTYEVVRDTYFADMNQYICYGQSLSTGGSTYSSPLFSDEYMLEGGIGGIGDSIVPLQNTNVSGVLMAAMSQMKALIEDEEKYAVILSSNGAGGWDINNLSDENQDPWKVGIQQAQKINDLCYDENLSHKITSISWLQGEANSHDTPEWYRDALIGLKNKVNDRYMPITNQSNRIPLFTYQISSEFTYWDEGVDVAPSSGAGQLMASQVDEEIFLVSPTYWCEFLGGLVHFTQHGYTRFGQKWGEVIFRVLYRGEDWKPLSPINIEQIKDNTIIIKFHVPDGALEFDDSIEADPVKNTTNKGFVLKDDGGELGISKISISSKDTVTIVADRAFTTNATVAYAWYAIGRDTKMPAGCLRDTCLTKGVYTKERLYNWCVRFKENIN